MSESKKIKAIDELTAVILKIADLEQLHSGDAKFLQWKEHANTTIKEIFNKDSEEFNSIAYYKFHMESLHNHNALMQENTETFRDGLESACQMLWSMIYEINEWPDNDKGAG